MAEANFSLFTTGVISQHVCQPGTLSFVARGTPAEHLFPLMTVSLNGQTLLATRVGKEKLYRVVVNEGGLIMVAFHNDQYLPDHKPPEDRNLFISDWHFQPDH